MRVLAIRGRNLASLAGDFAVDFEAEPLAGAGIFVITGPTGAGKSTLLDAMCLALFATVPRLGAAPAHARIETGQGDELAAGDVRAILRHGAGEGHAEVDFVGTDRGRYRARWSVARARQKAGGRMQAARLSFARLDTGEQLGGTRTETLEAIHRVIGLTADQFRRAVLLAQGDFEAFIRADANERALLLERLTGSAIYARVGRAAWEKAAGLRAALEAIEQRIAAQHGLDDAQRAAAEEAAVAATAALDSAAAAQAALDEAVRQEKRGEALAAMVEACAAALAAADAAREAAAPRRAALRLGRSAFAFAGDWTALGEAMAARDTALATVTQRAAEQAEALALARSAEAADVTARARWADAQAHAEALAPAIEEARTLDRRLAESGAALADLAAARTERAAALTACRTAEAEARAALGDAGAARDAEALWLAEHRPLATLAVREADLAADLADHAALAARIATVEEKRRQAVIAGEAADAAFLAAQQSEARAAENGEGAAALLAEAAAAAPADEEIARHTARRDALAALQPLALADHHAAERVAGLDEGIARRRDEAAAVAGGHAAATARSLAIAGTLPGVRGALAEARRAQALSDAASGDAATRLRETLVEGEPCPVCGATAHALTALDAMIGARAEADRARAAQLDTQASALAREEAVLADRLQSLTARNTQLATELAEQAAARATAEAAREAARALLARGAAAAGLDAEAPAFAQALADRLGQADAARARADRARQALGHAQRAEAKACAALDAARQRCATAGQAQRDAAQHLAAIVQQGTHQAETRDRLARGIDALVGDAADWRMLRDPLRWLADAAAAWRTREAGHASLVGALPRLADAVHEAATGTALALARAEEVEARAAALEAERAGLAATRSRLLGGEAVVAVLGRRDALLADAAAACEAARAGQSAAQQAGAAASARHEAARGQAGAAAADHARRHALFHARIAALSLDEAAVAAAARAGQPALDREEAALALLDRAAEGAATALAARRDDLALHDAAAPHPLAGEALAAAAAQARGAVESARATLADAGFRLRADDQVRQQTAMLRAELERERAQARVWLDLAELIGDREGRVFRRFAQGLTLDRLLAHANARLAELKPRYALERGQGGDMLIQVVDHDMAGEVRGVHNLSGGERFLISLALALGLAEMSTGRGLRIESLFIDEGFGALDTASLGQAIAVLEHLHASGRRVGVISHVEEVKERIPVKIEVTPVARGRSTVTVVVD